MSLFDVIRYPITDIYDPTQLENIPADILLRWGKELEDMSGDNFGKHVPIRATVYGHIRLIASKNKTASGPSIHNRMAMEKEIFTYRLKKMISDY